MSNLKEVNMQSQNFHNESGADKALSDLFSSESPKELSAVQNSLPRESSMSTSPNDEIEVQSSSASSSNEKAMKVFIPRKAKSKKWEWVFNQDFYNRIDKFLDKEELYPIDPKDQLLGIRQFSKGDGECKLSGSKSQAHSPRLISSSPIESKLFQRRMSLSLNPSKIIQRMCNPRAKTLNIKTSNPLLQKIKAIEEVDTPVLSRNNSECAASTPKRVNPKQISRILKDLSGECKSRGSSENPLTHSMSHESPELSSKRRSTDENFPLIKLRTASSLLLPSDKPSSERHSRRSKFFQDVNNNKQNYDDLTFEEKKSPNHLEEDECPPMA